MLNIAIVEDEGAAARSLVSALERWSSEKGEAVKTTVFDYAESFLNNYKPVYDIVFMDIKLKGINGMDAAHKLRENDPFVLLIFITSMAQFAIEGYEVNAVDYIIKPVEYYDLKLRLDRVCRRLDKKENCITIFVGGGSKRLRIQDIFYVESRGHMLTYYTASEEVSSYSKTMKNLEGELGEFGFARCSVSTLVNINHIKGITGNEIDIAGKKVIITRGYKKAFIAALTEKLPSAVKEGIWEE